MRELKGSCINIKCSFLKRFKLLPFKMKKLKKHISALRAFLSWAPNAQNQAMIFGTLILVQAILDMCSLALLFPYLTFLETGKLTINEFLISDVSNPLLITSFVLALSIVIAITRFLILKRIVRFAYHQEMLLSQFVMTKLFRLKFEQYVTLKKPDMHRLVSTEIPQTVNAYFVSILHVFMGILSITLITVLLLNVNFLATSIGLSFIILIYLTIIISKFDNIGSLGKDRLSLNRQKFEIFGNAIDSYKMIRVNGLSENVIGQFTNVATKYSDVHSKIQFATLSPRIIIDGVFLIAVVIIGYSIVFLDATTLINKHELLFFCVATLKLIPQFQIIYARLASANYTLPTVMNVNDLIEKIKSKQTGRKLENTHISVEDKIFKFIKLIELKDLTLDFDGKNIIKDLNFQFKIGYINVIEGPSGSGKTSLLNIIAGLIKPTSGNISLDHNKFDQYENPHWFEKIAYVDQFPFLIGEKVRTLLSEKIITQKKLCSDFGIGSEIDPDTAILQGGQNFSGGQRQRLAFLNAISKEKNILLLDEITSGLDKRNQKLIWNKLDELKDTHLIIMISHEKVETKSAKLRYVQI